MDELALLPFEAANFRFKWSNEVQRDNLNIYVSPSINISSIQSFLLPSQKIHQLEAEKAFELTSSDKDSKLIEGSLYPSFDLAIISSLNEVDSIIRPKRSINRPLIRARGSKFEIQKQLIARIIILSLIRCNFATSYRININ